MGDNRRMVPVLRKYYLLREFRVEFLILGD